MLPVVSSATNYLPVQAALVATPIPDNNTSYVTANAVAPSVSNAQVNNNASSNNIVSGISDEEAAIAASATNAQEDSTGVSASADLNSSAQSNFLAQLISQEIPASLQSGVTGLLAQYEKLVAYSYVKYKPSDAGIPVSSPSNAFGEILQQEKAAPTIPAPAPAPATILPAATEAPITTTAAAIPTTTANQAAVDNTLPATTGTENVPLLQPATTQPLQDTAGDDEDTDTSEDDTTGTITLPPSSPTVGTITTLASAPPLPQVTQAYASTNTRNSTPSDSNSLELA